TLGLLETVPPSDWFRMPAEGVTHVAWQVGHLAFAEYRLGMFRLRGERPGDGDLISPSFIACFIAETTPSPDSTTYPAPDEIRIVFDRVQDRLLAELADFS